MFRKRSTKAVIAAAASFLWLGYMIVGLQVIAIVVPTVRGAGPEGLAGFVGLISGVVVTGLVMWAVSD